MTACFPVRLVGDNESDVGLDSAPITIRQA
jgi:hypothetical protein